MCATSKKVMETKILGVFVLSCISSGVHALTLTGCPTGNKMEGDQMFMKCTGYFRQWNSSWYITSPGGTEKILSICRPCSPCPPCDIFDTAYNITREGTGAGSDQSCLQFVINSAVHSNAVIRCARDRDLTGGERCTLPNIIAAPTTLAPTTTTAPDCAPGITGAKCNSTCHPNCVGRVCGRDDGNCTISNCLPGEYGTMCNLTCKPYCNGGVCGRDDGNCINCLPGKYGTLCNLTCHPNCVGGLCGRQDGNCINCKSGGKYGAWCNLTCPSDCEGGVCGRKKGNCTRIPPPEEKKDNTLAIALGVGVPGLAALLSWLCWCCSNTSTALGILEVFGCGSVERNSDKSNDSNESDLDKISQGGSPEDVSPAMSDEDDP